VRDATRIRQRVFLRQSASALVEALGAIVLLSAAALKAVQTSTVPLSAQHIRWLAWGQLGLIEFEIVWGIWILGGIVPYWTRTISASIFAAFCAVSAARGVAGHVSCGCFGSLEVNPWLTALLDAFLAKSFWLTRGERDSVCQTLRSVRWRLALVSITSLAMGLPVGLYALRLSVTAGGKIVENAAYVTLEPDRWRGQRLPFLDLLDHRDELGRGRWHLFIYRRGCPKCYQALRTFHSTYDRGRGNVPEHWAFVELPPFGGQDASDPPPIPNGMIMSRVNGRAIWIAEVPFTVIMADGIVQ
jgi:hypothetical protein